MSSMRWSRALLALIAIVAVAFPVPASAADLVVPPSSAATESAVPSVAASDPSVQPLAGTGQAAPGDVTLTGTFRVAVTDDFGSAHSETFYSIDSESGSTALAVTGPVANGLGGALVRVAGSMQADGSVAITAASIVVERSAADNAAANAGVSPSSSPAAVQTRKIAVIVADYTDLSGYPVTADQANTTFNGSTASVNSWFQTSSRGRVATTAAILGPWHLGIGQCPGGTSTWSFATSVNAALAAATAHGYNLSSYDHVLLWTKRPCNLGDTLGIAYVPGKYVQIFVDWATYPADEPATSAMTASHELGHNLGLAHSNGLACFGDTGQVPLGASCSSSSYDDQYSTMGFVGSPVHALLDADRLRALGWLGAGESQTVGAAGTYSLVPTYSSTAGVRSLRIARPSPVVPGGLSGSWTLELRSTLTGTAWDQFTNPSYPVFSTVTSGVSIRYSEDGSGFGAFGQSYLVDTVSNASSTSDIFFWDAPLQVGGTFSDTGGGFTVTVNSVDSSGASVTIGDTQPPTAPASMSVAGLPNGGAQLSWQAAGDNLAVASYRIYRDGSQIGEVSNSTFSYVDPPAGTGGQHVYAVSAVDTAGLVGPQATANASLTPPPSAPLSVTATAGNSAALVSWSAPADGAPISGYAVTSSPGGQTCTTAGAMSCIVAGLGNGTPYTFTVTATNAIGTGPASSASNSVTPLPVPGRPTNVTGSPGDGTVAVTWAAPDDPGSSAISAYTVASVPDGKTCATGGAIGCTVGGLTDGVAYTFTVTATNLLGTGLPSDPSPAATPRTRPGVPVNVTAVASNGSVVVSWGAPPADGGSPVTAYDVVSTPDGITCQSVGPLSCTVSGLTNRVTYTFTVTATNVAGTSDPSQPSPGATPIAGATYVPVTPNRLVDSRAGRRLGLSASLSHNVPVAFQVTDRSSDPTLDVPTGAVAVTGNLTAVGEGSKGYFSLTPTRPSGTPGTSSINFPAGDIRANAVTVPLGPGGTLWVTFVGLAGKQADVVFDVTGYFLGNPSGATYLPLTPNRVLDSRAGRRVAMGASLVSGSPASFRVTGLSADPNLNVPADAIAIVGNLTAVGESSKGYFSLTPTRPDGTPTTSTLNFPKADTRANAVVAPIGANGLVWVTFIGTARTSADVIFDVTGYFAPDLRGATYVALTPNRVVDSRAGRRLGLSASLKSGVSAGFPVVGRSGDAALNVPTDAVGITGNLTAVGEGSKGYYALTPNQPGGLPTTSTINFPEGDIRANAVLMPLGTGGNLWVTFVGSGGTYADVVLDVSGYFSMH